VRAVRITAFGFQPRAQTLMPRASCDPDLSVLLVGPGSASSQYSNLVVPYQLDFSQVGLR